jgi:hypothetical protein
VRRPCKQGESHLPIVERPQDVSRAALDGFSRSQLGRRLCFRPATPAGRGASGHFPGALVAQVGDLRASPGVGIRDPQRGALCLVDLATAAVTNEHCFPRQIRLLNEFRGPDSNRKSAPPYNGRIPCG